MIALEYLKEKIIVFCLDSSESGGSHGSGSLVGAGKRSKHYFRSKTFKVEIRYAAKIPLEAIGHALKGQESDNRTQDALRVLDIVLKQKAANRFLNAFITILSKIDLLLYFFNKFRFD